MRKVPLIPNISVLKTFFKYILFINLFFFIFLSFFVHFYVFCFILFENLLD